MFDYKTVADIVRQVPLSRRTVQRMLDEHNVKYITARRSKLYHYPSFRALLGVSE